MLNRMINHAGGIYFFQAAIGPTTMATSLDNVDASHSGIAYVSVYGSLPCLMISGEQVMGMALAALPSDATITIKLDIEGFEYQVLESLATTAAFGRVACVIVECNDSYLGRYGDSSANLYELLAICGLRPTVRTQPEDIGAGHYDEIFLRPDSKFGPPVSSS
jgi:hypothetical protein